MRTPSAIGIVLAALACGGGDKGDSATDLGTPTGGTPTTPTTDAPPVVTLDTSMGAIVLELDDEAAPKTVRNFLRYAESGFFDGADGDGATVFHRVIPDFMIQGGGLRDDLSDKPTRDPIKNESDNGLSNARGTIAMARTDDPDSATSQFFINHIDNDFLDHSGADAGYAVFGAVIEGMDVVDAIAGVPTETVGFYADVPVTPVVIESVTVEGG